MSKGDQIMSSGHPANNDGMTRRLPKSLVPRRPVRTNPTVLPIWNCSPSVMPYLQELV